ncbi:MAG: hypothetical protein ACXW18_07350 [Pyrinomonadaceae bacterium]
MKRKRLSKVTRDDTNDMRTEYRIDYSESRPNRFAKIANEEPLVVMVDADISEVFTTSESVNHALRALIAAMPKSTRKRVS